MEYIVVHGTPMDRRENMTKDELGKVMCTTLYRQLIGILFYLTIVRFYKCNVVVVVCIYMENIREIVKRKLKEY
jgi:hypothetical protein